MIARKVSFATACAQFVNRYTCEHVPANVRRAPIKIVDGVAHWQAPQFATDREWYDATLFPGERGLHGNSRHCQTSGETWPCGMWLAEPGRVGGFKLLEDEPDPAPGSPEWLYNRGVRIG